MTLQEAIAEFRRRGHNDAAIALEGRSEDQWQLCETQTENREIAAFELDLQEWLIWAFYWEGSPEGHYFWEEICKQVN